MGDSAKEISKIQICGSPWVIFVMLGTNPYPFDRLLSAMRDYAKNTGERVVAQVGNTSLMTDIECHPFMAHAEIIRHIKAAEVVVCQGGYGSISDCLSCGAKVVAVPRKSEFGECVDNQAELVDAFADEKLLVPVMNIDELAGAIDIARNMQVTKCENQGLPMHIADTISKLISEKQK